MFEFDPPKQDLRLASLLGEYPSDLFDDNFHQSCELVHCYGLELAIELFERLGLPAHLGKAITVNDLLKKLDFHSRFRMALEWLLKRLAADGLISTRTEQSSTTYWLSEVLRKPELKALYDIGYDINQANTATLDLLDAAAAVYPQVAEGKASGEAALFGVGQLELWLNYFSNENPVYAINNWVGAHAAAARLAAIPSIRILEIGAGAGSGTDALLQVLSQYGLTERIEVYQVTEPSRFFRRRGERMLKATYNGIPFKFSSLDIDQPWREQGLQGNEFNLIYGVNCLHVAKDLWYSLDQARQTLCADGWLVAGECIRPFPGQPVWAELVFQILDSFITVKTDENYRPNPGFLTADQWRSAFICAQFGRVEVTPDQNRIREIYPRFFTGAVCAQGVSVAG